MSQRTSATHGSRSTHSQKIQCTIPRLCSHDQLGSRGLRKRVPPCDPCHRLQQPACCSHGLKKSVFCGVCSRSNPQVDRVFVKKTLTHTHVCGCCRANVHACLCVKCTAVRTQHTHPTIHAKYTAHLAQHSAHSTHRITHTHTHTFLGLFSVRVSLYARCLLVSARVCVRVFCARARI